MTLTLRTGVRTDVGRVREINEDVYFTGDRLVAIADGMGGLPAGEVASALAMDAMSVLETGARERPPLEALRDAVDAANLKIGQAVAKDTELDGMGTTLTALLRAGNRLFLVHVGDSRAYLLRAGVLTQVTRDDTYVQMLIEEGEITTEQARTHPHRSLVTQAMQGGPINPTFTVIKPRQGDRFMLCSDGLTDLVEDDAIAAVMMTAIEPARCADRLVELALQAGGIDNVTVLVTDVSVDD
jgi:serine/threonine protein phosphatase PrpC